MSIKELPDGWGPEQAALYAALHSFMVDNQSIFMHPDAPALSAEHWYTVCHNAAWVAAEKINCHAEETILRFVDADTGEELATDVKKTLQ